MSKPTGKLKPAVLCLLLGLALVVGVVVDMGFGRQYAGFLFGSPDEPPPGEVGPLYYDGGIAIGQWQIVQPPMKMRPDGYMIEVFDGGTKVPVMIGPSWYEDGTPQSEYSLFDASGSEDAPIPASSPKPQEQEPHPKVVMRQYRQDGSLLSETVWLYGLRQ